MTAIAQRNPELSPVNGNPATFIPKTPVTRRRRQEDGGDDREHVQAAIGLLAALEHDLLLQEPRAIAQLDDLGVKPIEPLNELLRPSD